MHLHAFEAESTQRVFDVLENHVVRTVQLTFDALPLGSTSPSLVNTIVR